jgi:hypothetical protein
MKNFLYLVTLFLIPSCYEEHQATAYEIKSNILNKSWGVEYYTDSGELKSVNDYVISFDKSYTINIFTELNQIVGSWAVYEGYNNPILQLRYSEYDKDNIDLNGNWNIINYKSNKITIKKDKIEFFLVLK